VSPYTVVDLPTAEAADAATLPTAEPSLETNSSDSSKFVDWEGRVARLEEALCWAVQTQQHMARCLAANIADVDPHGDSSPQARLHLPALRLIAGLVLPTTTQETVQPSASSVASASVPVPESITIDDDVSDVEP
jgi:hypothetical protein